MIHHLTTTGLRSTDRDLDLDRLNLLLGPNGSGKSSVMDAVRFAFLGHVPQVGKREVDTARLARDGEISVSVELDGDRRFTRTLARKKAAKGKAGDSYGQEVEASWLPPRTGATEASVAIRSLVGASDLEAAEHLDLRTLLECSPNERAKRIEQLLDASAVPLTTLQARAGGLLICRLAGIDDSRIPEDAKKLAAIAKANTALLTDGVYAVIATVLEDLCEQLAKGIGAATESASANKRDSAADCREATAARALIEERLGDARAPADALADLERRRQEASDRAAAARRDLERAEQTAGARKAAEDAVHALEEVRTAAHEALEAAIAELDEAAAHRAAAAAIVDPLEAPALLLVEPDADELTRAAGLRQQADAILDPDPVPAPVYPAEINRLSAERIEELRESARDLETQREAIVLPDAISTQREENAHEIARIALANAALNPWREVEAIGDALHDINRTAADRLRALAIEHGGDLEKLTQELTDATAKLNAAEKARDAREAERRDAINEAARLDSEASAARAEANTIEQGARAELATECKRIDSEHSRAVDARAVIALKRMQERVALRNQAAAIEGAARKAASEENARRRADRESAQMARGRIVNANAVRRKELRDQADGIERIGRERQTAADKAVADVAAARARLEGMQSGEVNEDAARESLATAEAELAEVAPKIEEQQNAVAREREMRALAQKIERLTALSECWSAAEWCCHRLREEDMALRSKGLAARMREFLRAAGKSEDPYLRAAKGICDFGWRRGDREISVEAMSGSETVLYCAALAASIITMRGAPERLLLVEAAELGVEACGWVLAGIAGIAESWGIQALVATWVPIEAPQGWNVIECGAPAVVTA